MSKEAIQTLRDCLEGAPVDFLGTGSDSKFAAREEREWRKTWEDALASLTLQKVFVVLRGETQDGGVVIGVRSCHDEAETLALKQPCEPQGKWQKVADNLWENGCDYVEIQEHFVEE